MRAYVRDFCTDEVVCFLTSSLHEKRSYSHCYQILEEAMSSNFLRVNVTEKSKKNRKNRGHGQKIDFVHFLSTASLRY